MSITLAITTYKRYELLIASYEKVIDDPRISEVVIVDDCSPKEIRDKVLSLDKTHPKIKTYTQVYNRGMSRNKRDAIAYAKNDWVIILDSDNIIEPKYLDAIPKVLDNDIIYCPDFAEPKFDYRKWSGYLLFGKQIAKNIRVDNELNMLLNTCNYLVNREMYLNVYTEPVKDLKGADTIAFNYDWLSYGCGFFVCPKMSYFHRVHEKSGFLENVDYNMALAAEYRNKISEL